MEEWKDIKGYEGLYQISSFGRVKSLLKNKLMKPQISNVNYMYVDLYKEKIKTQKKIHRLVAESFIENPNNKTVVNHIDGNKQNNRVDNLEWCTHSENIKHAYDKGLKKANVIEANKAKRVLTDMQVIEIKKLLNEGLTTRKIASIYNVGKTLIGNINCGKVYKNVV